MAYSSLFRQKVIPECRFTVAITTGWASLGLFSKDTVKILTKQVVESEHFARMEIKMIEELSRGRKYGVLHQLNLN